MQKRLIYVIACQLKQEYWPKRPVQPEMKNDEEAWKDYHRDCAAWVDALAPYYIVCYGRLELDRKCEVIRKAGISNYTYTQVEVNSYGLPD
jgi:hypothetical protein